MKFMVKKVSLINQIKYVITDNSSNNEINNQSLSGLKIDYILKLIKELGGKVNKNISGMNIIFDFESSANYIAVMMNLSNRKNNR